MITSIDNKAVVTGEYFDEGGLKDLREGLISLLCEITATTQRPGSEIELSSFTHLYSLSNVIWLMGKNCE